MAVTIPNHLRQASSTASPTASRQRRVPARARTTVATSCRLRGGWWSLDPSPSLKLGTTKKLVWVKSCPPWVKFGSSWAQVMFQTGSSWGKIWVRLTVAFLAPRSSFKLFIFIQGNHQWFKTLLKFEKKNALFHQSRDAYRVAGVFAMVEAIHAVSILLH